ncbi:hypothetical protein GB937_010654 [Aspergillus fischeri]|nr:hypothetical protein GB937_010654 [Aspergillus fischeri]
MGRIRKNMFVNGVKQTGVMRRETARSAIFQATDLPPAAISLTKSLPGGTANGTLAGLGFHYNSRTNILEYEDGSPFGYTSKELGVPVLEVLDPTAGFAGAVLTLLEVHRRLGHCGKSKLSSTIKRGNLNGDEVVGSDQFHCEACHLAKAKKRISHKPMD